MFKVTCSLWWLLPKPETRWWFELFGGAGGGYGFPSNKGPLLPTTHKRANFLPKLQSSIPVSFAPRSLKQLHTI